MKRSSITTIMSATIIILFLFTGLAFGQDALKIDSSGNVGIRTPSSPVEELHVQGDISLSEASGAHSSIEEVGGIYFTWDGSSSTAGETTYHAIMSTDGTDFSDDITMNSYGNIRLNIDSNNNGATEVFSIGTHTTGTGGNLFVVQETGNVGIGTTNPEASLHVTGNNTGSATVQGVSLGKSGTGATIELKGASSSTGIELIDFGYPSNDYRGRIAYYNEYDKMYFYTGGTSTAELVLSDGKIGIATSPVTELTVYGTKGVQWSDSTETWRLGRYYDDAARTGWVYLTKGTGGGNQNLGVGSLYVSGTFYNYSDENLKKNIQPISNALDKILQLDGVSFEWIDNTKDEKQHMGLIAQKVEEVFPDLIEIGADGNKGVAYIDLIAPLIESVKELKAENDSLAEIIEELEDRLAKLEANK